MWEINEPKPYDLMQYCPCGRKLEYSGTWWSQMTVDSDGKIVWAMCVHGVVFGEAYEHKDKNSNS
jgi:hypothetical protein